ncbi:MAG TPA: SDR family oxidoreductase, partial [Oscillatoriaceae cyanobacterium]
MSFDSPTPIAVVGLACLFPKADSLSGYWANIKGRVDAIAPVPDSHWAPEDYFDADPKRADFTYAKRGGFLEPVAFDPSEFGITPSTLEATDVSQLLSLMVAKRALTDAGYGPESGFAHARTSVVLGVTGTLQLAIPLGARLGHPHWRKALAECGVDAATSEAVIARIADAYVGWQEASFPGLLGNVVAGRVANRLNLGGTNCVVDAACASSLSACHLAALELAAGRSDLVVTGGVDAFNDIFMYMCFSKTPALSPTGDSRPFDADGDGTILGEGVGMVVLKRLADAERDGDRIYAVLKAMGTSSDGRGKAIYAPSADGQKRALQDAYARAGVAPETIELLEAHGTGTKVGDAVELSALTEVYRANGSEGQWCALGSVKSQIGHTKAAAGAAGLIKAALALHHKVLPPSIKVRQPLAELAAGNTPFYLNAESRPWLPRAEHPRRAAVSAFGFGGSNFHAVLEEYRSAKAAPDWDGRVELLAFAADDSAALDAHLETLNSLDWNALRVEAAASRAAFDAAKRHRLLVVVEPTTDRAGLFARVRAQLQSSADSWSLPEGVYFGSGAPEGKLAVLFPGQGAQYVGMGRDWACLFPEALEALARANAAFGANRPGDRLSDVIYPAPAFEAGQREAQEARLRSTQHAQPAIGAVSLGLYRVLAKLGLAPAAFAGHSYGELTALCAAGRLAEADFYTLSCLRGRLMAEGEGDRGAMLAVQAPLREIEALIQREGLQVVLANKNAPAQGVLSGATAAIDLAEEACRRAGLKSVRLPVSAAFHSALVSEAQKPFAEALQGVTFASGADVYANTTGARYPEDAASLLAGQLAKPVEFVAQIEAMAADGVRTFLEVGPGARLTGLVRAILGDQPHQALAVDSSNGRRDGVAELARAIAALAAMGYALNLADWQGGEAAVQALKPGKKGMSVMLSGANYRAPRKPLPEFTKPVAPMVQAAPVQASPAMPAPSPAIAEALRATQESMAALQQLQAQTAQLHQQFLAGQEATQQAIVALLIQQGQAMAGAPVGLPTPAPVVPEIAKPSSSLVEEVAVRPIEGSPQAIARPQPPLPALRATGPAGFPPTRVGPSAREEDTRPAVVQAAPSGDRVAQVLLAVVSEKTGYPAEMLALEMDLEADLGIDSIKRVEILSALQEALPEAPTLQPDQLSSLRTLAQIGAFLSQGKPVEVRPAAPVVQTKPTSAPSDVDAVLKAVVAEKTGYPVEMLAAEMELESDLGIDSIKRVEILSALQEALPEAPVLQPEHMTSLRTLAQIGAFLSQGLSATERAKPSSSLVEEVPPRGDGGAATSGAVRRNEAPLPALRATGPAGFPPTNVGPSTREEEVRPTVVQAAPSGDRVAQVLLAVVSEKTGYPAEMLALEMDLEADLGIDSIKRVEILSALQEALPEAPTLQPDQLSSLRTLAQLIAFLSQGAPTATPAPVAAQTLDRIVLVPAPRPASPLETVLAVVAEKTGYPADMLGPDMDLEADLGIDSIKRVEIVAALQEALPDAPHVKPEHLGDLRTLASLAAFLAGDTASAPESAVEPTAPLPAVIETADSEIPENSENPEAPFARNDAETEAPDAHDTPAEVESVVPEAPNAPASAGAPSLEAAPHGGLQRHVLRVRELPHEGRTKVPFPVGTDVWVLDDLTALGAGVVERLASLGYKSRQLRYEDVDTLEAPTHLTALVVIAPRTACDDGQWKAEGETFMQRAFRAVQLAGPALRARGRQGGTMLLTVSHLDGAFGLEGLDDRHNPLTGALAGLTKTARLEWPEVCCKAVDVARDWEETIDAANAVVDELFLAGPIEVGISPRGRVQLELEEAIAPAAGATPHLAPGDLVIVSGGARGVTAESALALASAYRPTLVLLGRTPLSDEPDWLAGLTDEREMKQALLDHADAPLAPKALLERYREVLANREVRRNLQRMEQAGARVVYRALDVRDGEAVAALFEELRTGIGPIRGLVHGAGVLADRWILDKTPEQFVQVMDTKVSSLRGMLAAILPGELRVLALFSSITARRGRVGQVDYAMANEALNKIALQQARLNPECRVVSINWGPWDGGMVTPALKKVFADEGVGLVPLLEGGEFLVRELAAPPGAAVEVLVLGAPPAGAMETVAPGTPRVERFSTAFTRTLEPGTHAFLSSHVINGKAVLPVAVILEWLAHGALHANPGLRFHGLEDFRVTRGVILGSEPYGIRVQAGSALRRDG